MGSQIAAAGMRDYRCWRRASPRKAIYLSPVWTRSGQAEVDDATSLVSSLPLISIFLPSLNKSSNANVNINVTQLAALESTLTLSEPVGLTVSKRVSWQLKKPQKLAKANASLGGRESTHSDHA